MASRPVVRSRSSLRSPILCAASLAFSGMGALFAQGLNAGDPNPVMAYFIVVAIFAITFNFLADLSYSALDPRVRAK